MIYNAWSNLVAEMFNSSSTPFPTSTIPFSSTRSFMNAAAFLAAAMRSSDFSFNSVLTEESFLKPISSATFDNDIPLSLSAFALLTCIVLRSSPARAT